MALLFLKNERTLAKPSLEEDGSHDARQRESRTSPEDFLVQLGHPCRHF